MKAVRIHEHGGIDKLRFEEVEQPRVTTATDAVVRLNAAALNHADIWNRRGLKGAGTALPRILGGDGAGVVAEVGSAITHVKPGDAVCLYPLSGCGRCEFCLTERDHMCARVGILGESDDGTYAEYVRIPGRNCFLFPEGLSFEEAAAFPLDYLAAWRMLVTNAELKPGEHLLVLGIGGGVTTAALQIAKQIGAHVIVTSNNDEKLEMAGHWGADHGINDQGMDFAREARTLTRKRGVDVVVDCIGGESWVKSLAALAKGGRLVTCAATAGDNPQADLKRIFWNHLKIFGSLFGSRKEFSQVLNYIRLSRMRPIIDELFPLKEAAAAQQRMDEGRQFGKIVLQI